MMRASCQCQSTLSLKGCFVYQSPVQHDSGSLEISLRSVSFDFSCLYRAISILGHWELITTIPQPLSNNTNVLYYETGKDT